MPFFAGAGHHEKAVLLRWRRQPRPPGGGQRGIRVSLTQTSGKRAFASGSPDVRPRLATSLLH
jgi:hypothetical protein